VKLAILSDLHNEFAQYDPPPVEADAIVLAGDVHVGSKGLDWATQRFGATPVIYVPGNHEYYGRAIPRHTDELRARAAGTTVRVLDNESTSVGDTVFLCCTLWTDFELFGDFRTDTVRASDAMTDYRRIRLSPSFRKLRPSDTALLHSRSVRWLGEQLRAHAGRHVVVVTHHAPSLKSVPARLQEDRSTAAYASHLDALVESSGAALWVHGHLHASSDYRIGATRVVANPRGYPDEPNPAFAGALVLDV
jgi:predicted phosphodiesterase